MTLTLKEVDHIALLARLELSDEEKRHYQQQLSHILDHIAQLQKLETGTIDAAAGKASKGMRLREDEPRFGLTTCQALENAPDVEDGQFRVPPVME
jgi:aspartyl-tRNA(Asn)/glutamyl-tRNA(Gln) amidotransferase subunit C